MNLTLANTDKEEVLKAAESELCIVIGMAMRKLSVDLLNCQDHLENRKNMLCSILPSMC